MCDWNPGSRARVPALVCPVTESHEAESREAGNLYPCASPSAPLPQHSSALDCRFRDDMHVASSSSYPAAAAAVPVTSRETSETRGEEKGNTHSLDPSPSPACSGRMLRLWSGHKRLAFTIASGASVLIGFLVARERQGDRLHGAGREREDKRGERGCGRQAGTRRQAIRRRGTARKQQPRRKRTRFARRSAKKRKKKGRERKERWSLSFPPLLFCLERQPLARTGCHIVDTTRERERERR